MAQQLVDLGFGVHTEGEDTPTLQAMLDEFGDVYQLADDKSGNAAIEALADVEASSIQLEDLQAIMPALEDEKAEGYLKYLNGAMFEAGIDTDERKAAFLAQLAHESYQFKYFEEIASGEDYEWRRSLGNTQAGDGARFKGRGAIQLTGRNNYTEAGDALGVDLVDNPELAADPSVAFRTAAWYWNEHGLNDLADAGDFTGITQEINGGQNGAEDRERYHAAATAVLSD